MLSAEGWERDARDWRDWRDAGLVYPVCDERDGREEWDALGYFVSLVCFVDGAGNQRNLKNQRNQMNQRDELAQAAFEVARSKSS